MCAKKNLSAKDLSEKFGFQISEHDLAPDFDKDSKYLNQMADLSALIPEPVEKESVRKQEPAEKEPENQKEETFAELFEARSTPVSEEVPEASSAAKPAHRKLVSFDDGMDFGKLFRQSGAKVMDKDKTILPDSDYEPFEISEDKLEQAGKQSFHSFEDLAGLAGKKKRK